MHHNNNKDKENISTDFIAKLISNKVSGQAIVTVVKNILQPYIVINKIFIEKVCRELKANAVTQFNHLACLTGIDYRGIEDRFELVYHLYSTLHTNGIVIKVTENIDESFNISFPSMVHIWQAANWYEREIFDLFGVKFINHPNLTRILLPEDWEGYPLRKDYKASVSWHNMPIEYDREDL